MPRSAAACRTVRKLVLTVAAIVALAATSTAAASPRTPHAQTRTPLWVMVVDASRADMPNLAILRAARASGVQAVLTRGTWSRTRWKQLTTTAAQLKLTVIRPFPLPLSINSAASLTRACARRSAPIQRCALEASSSKQALRLARTNQLAYVVARLADPSQLGRLIPNPSRRTRIVGIVPLRAGAKIGRAWTAAMKNATNHPGTALAVQPARGTNDVLSSFLTHIGGKVPASIESGDKAPASSAVPDTVEPTTPRDFAISTVTPTSVSLIWTPSTDDVAVAGYRVSVAGTTTIALSTSFLADGLVCGRTYTVTVAAFDEAGNMSSPAALSFATAACSAGGGSAATRTDTASSSGTTATSSSSVSGSSTNSAAASTPDTSPPSIPTALNWSAPSATAFSVSWNAAGDNVGVTGYALSLNGAALGNTFGTSYAFTGLTCGTSYRVAVVAVDAAGNRSGAASVSAATAACASSGTTSDPVVYLAPSGSDATCARSVAASPCATPARAWALAQAGDTIQVADGDYTSGCGLAGTKTSDTTFVGSAAARIVCGITLPSGHVHVVFDGPTLYQIGTTAGASDVTVRNLAITCQDAAPYTLNAPDNKCNSHIGITGTSPVSNWTFSNVVVGPTYDSANCGGQNTNVINAPVSNLTFDRVVFRDARRPSATACGSTQHDENLYIDAAGGTDSNVTFNRCAFTNGAASGQIVNGTADGSGPDSTGLMLTSTSGTGTFSGLTITNCQFYGAGTGLEGNVSAQFSNGSSVAFSTFPNGGLLFECSAANCPSGYTDLTFKGLIAFSSGGGCPDSAGSGGIKYVYNVWFKAQYNGGTPTRCGSNDAALTNPTSSTDIRAQLFTNYLANDFTLVGLNPTPVGFVPTAQGCASDDYAGTSRPGPHPTACNAGAYENR